MKKILMINTLPIHCFSGENAKIKTAGNQTLYNTLKGYDLNGYEVKVLSFCDIEKKIKPFENIIVMRSKFYKVFNMIKEIKNIINKKKVIQNEKVSIDIVRSGETLFAKVWYKIAYLEGILIAKKFKPDAIYGYEIYSTRPALKIANKLKVPCITRFQGTELGFFLDNDNKFWSAKDYINGTRVDSDLIIMANDGTDGDEVLKKLSVDIEKTRFWVNGLHDKEKYLSILKNPKYKENMNIPDDAFIICTANRFVDWKRIDRILYVIKGLNKLNKNVYLVAIGDGPEKTALMNIVKDQEIENIKFLGAVEHEDTINHIANSDLYITLNHSGNLGNSILEALALGVPVATIRNKSVQEVLKHKYNSILFEDSSIDKIVNDISHFIDSRDELDKIKINTRNFAREHLLSWDERMKKEVNEVNYIIDHIKK